MEDTNPTPELVVSMNQKQPFKWRHFQGEIILLNVRRYLRYSLSYRDLEEIRALTRLGKIRESFSKRTLP
jgi:transposase-like protein